ncbi:MAG: hypothetical protein AAB443_01350 [Patescibacteria group bacterium]
MNTTVILLVVVVVVLTLGSTLLVFVATMRSSQISQKHDSD